MIDDVDDFNYNENRDKEDVSYEDDEMEDIELNRDFDSTDWYKDYGL